MLRPSRRSDVLVLGDDVDPLQPVQLDPVLEGAQERVGVVQRLAVLATDVPAPAELSQRAQRGGQPDPLVVLAVHQLEQLDGELDVAQSAGTELELTVGVPRRDVLDHPASHRLGLGDESLALRAAPHQRRHHRHVLLRHGEVAGHRARLEQRLELPGLRPALVVAAMAGDRAHQQSRLALGTQRRVHRPDRALRGVVGADPHQVAGQLGGGPGRPVVRRAVGGLVDEDDVDVGDVVELVATALAHRDHRQPGESRVLARPVAGRSPARPPGCPRPGRRARPPRRRPRGGGPGPGRPVAAAPGGTRLAGRPRPRRRARWRSARGRRGRRRRPAAAPRARRTPRGGWSPSSGRTARASARGAGPGGRRARRSRPGR